MAPPPQPTNEADVQKDGLEADEDVIEWQPPPGQRGDGKTHLNAKFGY
jgi:hypothetical protein